MKGLVLSRWTALPWILLLAVALRLLVLAGGWLSTGGRPLLREPDSGGYIRLAEELARSGRFFYQGRPELARTPGYPLFLLPGAAVARIDQVAIAAQMLLACLAVYLVYRTGRLLFERDGTALLAAALAACEPLSVLYTSKLLTETVFTLLVVAFTFFLVRYLQRSAASDLAAAAVALASAIYVRPIAYFLPAAVALLLAARVIGMPGTRLRGWAHLAWFVAIAGVLLGAWQVRNYALAGYPRFAAVSDINLYYYHAAAVRAAQQGRPLADVQQEMGYQSEAVYDRLHPEQRDWPVARRYEFMREQAIEIMRDDPLTLARVHLAGMHGTLTDVGTSAYAGFFALPDPPPAARAGGFWQRLQRALEEKPAVTAVHLVLRVTLMVYLGLALVGLMSRGTWTSVPLLFLAVIAVYFVVMSGGPVGYHRFRLPIVPIVSLFAGQGLMSIRPYLRTK